MMRVHALYRRLDNDAVCVYCGDRATGLDHFVPVSLASLFAGTEIEVRGRFLLPSCGDCNGRASNKIFRTVAAKRRWIQASLRKSYRKLLVSPDWTQAEVEELEWTLRTAVMALQAKKRRVLARLMWRNTANPAAAEIAKVRSNRGASGNTSAGRDAETSGTLSIRA